MEYTCCHKPFSTRDSKKLLLTCTSCKDYYHADCVVARKDWVPDSGFKATWLCPSCVQRGPRDNKDETPIRATSTKNKTVVDSSNVTTRPVRSKSKEPVRSRGADTELQVVPLNEVRSIIREEIKLAVGGFEKSLKELRFEFTSLKESVNFISNQYDSVVKRVDEITAQLKSSPDISDCLADIDSKLRSYERDLNEKDQWVRRSNVEIVGLPETKGENLIEIVSRVAKVGQFNINCQTDIDFVTRVAPMDKTIKKPKPIVVRFTSRYRKDEFLAKVRAVRDFKASDIGLSRDFSRLYFNEHLTKTNKLLLQSAKKLANEKLYKYVWVRNCSIMVRKGDTSPVINIGSVLDLKKII